MPSWIIRLSCVLTPIVFLAACRRAESPSANTFPPPPKEGVIDILFTYGSEKQAWVDAVTADFNRRGVKNGSGKAIRVTAQAKGSGECLDELQWRAAALEQRNGDAARFLVEVAEIGYEPTCLDPAV